MSYVEFAIFQKKGGGVGGRVTMEPFVLFGIPLIL